MRAVMPRGHHLRARQPAKLAGLFMLEHDAQHEKGQKIRLSGKFASFRDSFQHLFLFRVSLAAFCMLLKDLFKERPSPLEILEAERQGRPTPRGRWPQRKKISTRGDFYDSLLSQISPGLGGSIVTIADAAYQILDRGHPSQCLVVLADDADGSIAAVRRCLPTIHIYSFRNSRDGTGFADFLSPPIAAVMLPGALGCPLVASGSWSRSVGSRRLPA